LNVAQRIGGCTSSVKHANVFGCTTLIVHQMVNEVAAQVPGAAQYQYFFCVHGVLWLKLKNQRSSAK